MPATRYLACALVLGCAACLESPPGGGGDGNVPDGGAGSPDANGLCDEIIGDRFEDSELGPAWEPWQVNGGSLAIGGGHAALGAGPGEPDAYSHVTSNDARPMGGTVLEARFWVDMVGYSDATVLFFNEAGDSASIQVWNGQLWSELSGDEFCDPCPFYTSRSHIAVRVSAGVDEVRAEWSDDDGQTWMSLGTGSPFPAGNTSLQVYIAAPGEGDGGTIYVDDIRWLDCGGATS